MSSFESFGVERVTDESLAKVLDAQDELAEFREQFLFPAPPPEKKVIYLCGNSLGIQPKGITSIIFLGFVSNNLCV